MLAKNDRLRNVFVGKLDQVEYLTIARTRNPFVVTRVVLASTLQATRRQTRSVNSRFIRYLPFVLAHLAFWAAAIRALPSALIFLRWGLAADFELTGLPRFGEGV